MKIKIAGFVNDSIVDGPGLRYTIFTQGCPHNCPGCHNPETHDPDGGKCMDIDDIISKFSNNPVISGITLSGGEPFEQAGPCVELARAAKNMGLNVWVYSGYTLEQLLGSGDEHINELLQYSDVLIDGLFIQAKKTLGLPFRGSSNQRLIDIKKSLAEGCVMEHHLEKW